ncbi:MAG: monovalent cation/H+ antiporter subunit D family protein, partial [Euzebyales bacterium]|nr:monovalent cation/H+ antiporter subunit D family protein [Euzebyales bacterium]
VEEPGAPTGFRRALLVAPAVVLAAVTALLGPGAQPVVDLSTAAAEALLEPGAWIDAVTGA